MAEGDYEDRYQSAVKRIQPTNRISKDVKVDQDQMILVATGKRNNVAQVMDAYPDGSCMIQWWNTKKMDGNKNACFYPSWYDPSSRHGEVAAVKGEVPTWEIVSRRDIVALMNWDEGGKASAEHW